MGQNEMVTGKVKFFNKTKGFGFIEQDKGGENMFFHISGMISREVNDGDEVSYKESSTNRGPCAVDVTVLYYFSRRLIK